MSNQEKLADALFTLGIKSGVDLTPDTAKLRYRRLIAVWHPDRFPTDDGKKDAEENLREINNAYDILKAHFESDHKNSGPCACRPSGTRKPTGETSAPGPGTRRRSPQEEAAEDAEAAKRDAERRNKAAQQTAEKQAAASAAAEAAAAEQAKIDAAERNEQIRMERLRWRCSIALIAAWVGISLFAFLGNAAKHVWHDSVEYWKDNNPFAALFRPAPETSKSETPKDSIYQKPVLSNPEPNKTDQPPPADTPGYQTIPNFNSPNFAPKPLPQPGNTPAVPDSNQIQITPPVNNADQLPGVVPSEDPALREKIRQIFDSNSSSSIYGDTSISPDFTTSPPSQPNLPRGKDLKSILNRYSKATGTRP